MNLTYHIGYWVCNLLDRIAQQFVRTGANRLCYVSMPDYSDNAYYVYRHALQTRSNLEHIWLVHSFDCREQIEREFAQLTGRMGVRGNSLRILKKRSLAGYCAYLLSRYIFHTHGAYTFSTAVRNRHVVNLFHGMPIKCIGRLDATAAHAKPAFGTMHIATSTLFRYIVALSFDVTIDKVLLTGMPRCDALLDSSPERGIRSQVDCLLNSKGKSLVLWLPTFRSMARKGKPVANSISFLDDLDRSLLSALDEIAGHYNCVVVVKLHPYDALNFEVGEMSFLNIRFLRASEWVATGLQLYDLVACVDGLMSDVSSILVDFLITKKPVGIIGFNPQSYSRQLTLPINQLTSSGCFDTLDSEQKLEDFFEAVSQNNLRTISPGSFESLLYEFPDNRGSETVLNAVGLIRPD